MPAAQYTSKIAGAQHDVVFIEQPDDFVKLCLHQADTLLLTSPGEYPST
jgi:hypothetical protein